MGGMLPPGPREPAALQTVEWIARPTAFLRRCQARHGEPFTVRVAWADAPMVLVSDPDSIRRVFTAERMASRNLCWTLCEIEESPWGGHSTEWRGDFDERAR